MTLDEFRQLAETWGGDLQRWPQTHRDAAATFAQTPVGAHILAQAQALDALIWPAAPDISERRAADAAYAVMSRLAAETSASSHGFTLFHLPRWLMPGTGLACAAALGLMIGFQYPLGLSEPEMFAQTALAAILDNGPVGPEWVLQ